MALLEEIIEGRFIKFNGQNYKILGKAIYSTRNDSDSIYAKILLENHHVLVIVPDEMIYFGENKGHLKEFDSFADVVLYNGQQLQQVNHDYQIRLNLIFGPSSQVEGNVEFWDYEASDTIISIAEIEGTKERADVVATYISFDDVEIV